VLPEQWEGRIVTDQFRLRMRQWCEANVPRDWRSRLAGATKDEYVAFQREWLDMLREAGFAAPHWPGEWGGGFDAEQVIVMFEELARARAPRLGLFSIGLHHAAATLLGAGTPDQVARHLPAILRGEIWCQAFSEPGAGSDLAALATRAVRQGDDYVLNGQKIWSSFAHFADFGLFLARTGTQEERNRGISFFILDMRSPGVEVRPIVQSTGDDEFCEVFLTDVRVPAANLVGQEGKGWGIAQLTLGEERGLAVVELAERLYFRVLDLAAAVSDAGSETDVSVRRAIAALLERVAALRAMSRNLSLHPDAPGLEVDISIVKVFYSEVAQDLARLATSALGLSALRQEPIVTGGSWETGSWYGDYLASWIWTISGGTNEIHRNIIARRGLGLRSAA
jgi:alkylation response protein AidB-like acyl-CoA dehydrogenase